MHTATCHCGSVRIEIDQLPEILTSCNCSICRRYSGLWGYYTRDQVRIRADPAKLKAYAWGDRTLEFVHCAECGCVTHWDSMEQGSHSRLAINARMLPPEILETLPVRRLDGADTWEYLS